MKRPLVRWSVLAGVVILAAVGALFVTKDRAFNAMLTTAEEMNAAHVWAEYEAYTSGRCPSLLNADTIEPGQIQRIAAGLYTEIPVPIITGLQTGIDNLNAIWMPPVAARDLELAREAIVKWAELTISTLEETIAAGVRIRNASSQEYLQYMAELQVQLEQAQPSTDASEKTAEKRLTEAALTDGQARRAGVVFKHLSLKCSEYEPAATRWP